MICNFDKFINQIESNMMSFNENIQESADLIDEVLTQCNVDVFESHYVTESTKKTFVERMKEFFAKIVNNFRTFVKEIKSRVDGYYRKKEFRLSLQRSKEKLLEQKDHGVRYVEMKDVWYYRTLYRKLNKELWTYVKRFEKCKYKKAWQIEDDIEKFDQILDKYAERLDEARESTKRISIDEAINFVINELRGKSDLYKDLNEEIIKFEDLKNRADQFETRFEIVGDGVIQEKTTILGKVKGVFTRMLSWVKKQLLKLMMFGIFLFA